MYRGRERCPPFCRGGTLDICWLFRVRLVRSLDDFNAPSAKAVVVERRLRSTWLIESGEGNMGGGGGGFWGGGEGGGGGAQLYVGAY